MHKKSAPAFYSLRCMQNEDGCNIVVHSLHSKHYCKERPVVVDNGCCRICPLNNLFHLFYLSASSNHQVFSEVLGICVACKNGSAGRLTFDRTTISARPVEAVSASCEGARGASCERLLLRPCESWSRKRCKSSSNPGNGLPTPCFLPPSLYSVQARSKFYRLFLRQDYYSARCSMQERLILYCISSMQEWLIL